MAQIIVAFVFGVAFVVTLIVLAMKFPHPTLFQYNVFRIVLALAAGGVAAMIPGFINVEFNPGTELLVRAGGAIAVFVIVFFFNPAQLASKSTTADINGGISDFVKTNPLLSPVWDSFGPTLQDAFVLAANAARKEGKDIISTRTLFAALHRLHPGRLAELFSQLPAEALPDPVADDIPVDARALEGIRRFSTCVQDSLDHLTPNVSAGHRLTSEDVFIDISKHGKGRSVARLRTHGVDVKRINELVSQLGWQVVQRA